MEHIQEMARLGSIKNIEIWVYHENLMNPSFHIKTKTYEIVLQIKDFKILEWKYRISGQKNIPTSDKLIIYKFLTEKHRKFGTTNWQVLLIYWNDSNLENQLSEDTKIPSLKEFLNIKDKK